MVIMRILVIALSKLVIFLLSSRYYSPKLGRFIQPADVSSLNPSNTKGLNLYAYGNNNPIGIAYSSSGAKMLSSITWSIYKSSVVTLGTSWRTAVM